MTTYDFHPEALLEYAESPNFAHALDGARSMAPCQ